MLINRKWVLTLGILALAPQVTMAGQGDAYPWESAAKSPQVSQQVQTDQQLADQIANRLRQARLSGHDIEIEVTQGVATLKGMINDSRQKEIAGRACSTLAGISKVNNQLGLINPEPAQSIRQTGGTESAGGVTNAAWAQETQQPVVSPILQTAFNGTPVPPPSMPDPSQAMTSGTNQQIAEKIAESIQQSGLSGYDIAISYNQGVAGLEGSVQNPMQIQAAYEAAMKVPGVKSVQNQLRMPAPQASQPIQNTSFQPPMGQGYAPQAMQAQPVYGHPGPGPVSPVYNQPNLPEYAWPAQAAAPNYAAVQYPSQYSASAFPYIGPFYPYPQVPLEWRSVQMDWDDGIWKLRFDPKTDKWWWFVNPKNW